MAKYLDRQQAASLALNFPSPSRFGNNRGVTYGPDIMRVQQLPRRKLDYGDHAAAYKWTSILRKREIPVQCDCLTRYGQECISQLLAIQGIILEEAYQQKGVIAFAGVGSGKTGVSLLLPMILPGVKTAVLLLPKNVMSQLINKDYPRWARHWHVPTLAGHTTRRENWPILHLLPYSMLSSQKANQILEQLLPDLIISDEAHAISSTKHCARTNRVRAYIKDHPQTMFVPLSGSFQEHGTIDYFHLADMALREGSPVPRRKVISLEWDSVLSAEITGMPAAPGALLNLGRHGETVTQAFANRLRETPGVVVSEGEILSTPLHIHKIKLELPKVIKETIRQVEKTWTRPDGEELLPDTEVDIDNMSTRKEDRMSESFTVASVLRQLHAGFYTRWKWTHGETPEMIQEWMDTRKVWTRELREQLKTPRRGMDSPGLLRNAAQRWWEGWVHDGKRYPPKTHSALTWASQSWPEWHRVAKTVQPDTEAIWVHSFLVQHAVEWGQRNVGIIWYLSPAVGQAIARAGKFEFFGRGEEASAQILQAKGDRTIVASIRAHGTGKNLQMFSRALVTQIPASQKIWEQLLGRLHRRGQKADKVIFDVYQYGMLVKAFEHAQEKAQLARETLHMNLRLLYAVES